MAMADPPDLPGDKNRRVCGRTRMRFVYVWRARPLLSTAFVSMSPIHVIRHHEPAGPFTEEEIRAQLSRGELTAADFAWREGMAEWQPLATVIALPTTPPPPAQAARRPPETARVSGAPDDRTDRVPGGLSRPADDHPQGRANPPDPGREGHPPRSPWGFS